MELWIRNQDKLELTKINSIGIEYDKKLVGYGNVCVKLGEYKSKQRALEVLDEIQNILHPKIMFETKGGVDTETLKHLTEAWQNNMPIIVSEKTGVYELATYVYEMPEE